MQFLLKTTYYVYDTEYEDLRLVEANEIREAETKLIEDISSGYSQNSVTISEMECLNLS